MCCTRALSCEVRTTSFLLENFRLNCSDALRLTSLAEKSTSFTYTNRLHVYEAAYLLIFCAWENLLEESFIRFICSYQNKAGRQTLAPTKTFQGNLISGRAALFGSQSFLLWHSPNYSIRRSKIWFINGKHETVITSALADLEDFAAIRHYIAHRNSDCAAQFDTAARRLSGSGVLGTRAGRFLRQTTVDSLTGAKIRWIDRIYSDLDAYAKQIVE